MAVAVPFVSDPDLTIHVGDVRDVLPRLPAESVECVATSPPFFGLRDYGVDGQIGLEETPEEWASELVAVFRECRRLVRPAGSLWVECGDGYAQYDGQGNKDDPREPGMHGTFRMSSRLRDTAESRGDRHSLPAGYKRKDLIGSPFLLAFALRADGWYWRGCYPWHKPNAMPESVRDRCTTGHSYLLHFSKQPRYFFDGDAIAEPMAPESAGRYAYAFGGSHAHTLAAADRDGVGVRTRTIGMRTATATRQPRSVWTIPTTGFPGAHFATWPEKLAERILKAGCPEWVCGTCGKPRERIVERTPNNDGYSRPGGHKRNEIPGQEVHRGSLSDVARWNVETLGWSDCGHGNFCRGVVLDPFGGSGTTGLVARRLGRAAILVELNEEYARMAAERCQQLSLLADGVA